MQNLVARSADPLKAQDCTTCKSHQKMIALRRAKRRDHDLQVPPPSYEAKKRFRKRTGPVMRVCILPSHARQADCLIG